MSEKTILIVYAEFWRRFCAYLMDVILIYISVLIMLSLHSSISYSIPGNIDNFFILLLDLIIFPWFYHAGMECSSKQATLGKMVFKIKVTDLYGNRISFGKATKRFWCKALVSTIILFIGFVIAAFTKKKQALHDILVSTLVIDRM